MMGIVEGLSLIKLLVNFINFNRIINLNILSGSSRDPGSQQRSQQQANWNVN
jgi:hypothetical protein